MLTKAWDRFGNTFEFHPNLFTIRNSPRFKLPYPGAVEIQQTISEAILSYSVMSEAEQLELEAEDQDRSSTSAISRLSTSDDSANNMGSPKENRDGGELW